ncbi:MAG: dUTP diphosphatase [Treponema sp.]|jgi:dUTP pyrophosphatase|nr:dUTP diphosphatase [Treponema sp.]
MNREPALKILRKDTSIPLPQYESEYAAGFDLRAFLDAPFDIPPLGRAKIPTGLRIEIPAGYEAQVRPRSGLALRRGVTVLNSPGTIDSDYRGDLEIILINLGAETFTVRNGDRIAQMVVAPVCRVKPVDAASLTETRRGEGGFGSTGV